MSIVQDKLEAFYEECLVVTNKNFLLKQAFQSLLGKPIYIQNVSNLLRYLSIEFLRYLETTPNSRKIQLTFDFHRDIQWFLAFLSSYNDTLLGYLSDRHGSCFA